MSQNERDEQLAAELRNGRLPQLAPDFKAQLADRLMAQYERKPHHSTRFALAGILTLVFAVIAAAWLARPQPVSAAEILNRASAVKVQSYQGVIATSRTASLDYIWFQAPANKRDEFYQVLSSSAYHDPLEQQIIRATPIAPIQPSQLSMSVVDVSNGADAWEVSFWEGAPIARQLNPDELDAERFFGPNTGTLGYKGITSDLQSLLSAVGNDFADAKLIGNDTIAGRSAYLIQLTPKTPLLVNAAHIKLWIDQATYLQLGIEYIDSHGQSLYKSIFDNLSINVPLNSSLFTFVPPSTMKVLDLRAKVAPTQAELTAAWNNIAATAKFLVVAPAYIPAYLTANAPVYDPARTMVFQSFSSKTSAGALRLDELKEGVGIGGESVQIGKARWFYQESFDTRILALDRSTNGMVLIGQDEVTKDDLIKIAQSLMRVQP